MADMETEEMHTSGNSSRSSDVEEPQRIDYIREMNIKLLKHRKDVRKTSVSSSRSEAMKDLSLDEIIAERKILEVPKKHFRRDKIVDREELDMSLEELMQKKAAVNKDRSKMDKSLDEIIKEEREKKRKDQEGLSEHENEDEGFDVDMNEGDITGHGRKRKREADDDEDIFIPSPLEVLSQLTEEGIVIEQEIGKQTNEGDGRSHNWRSKLKCGTIEVQCESARKILAKQGAAMELVKLMREAEPRFLLPRCAIPEACYYDPVVCERLLDVTRSMGVEEPRFEIVQTRKCNRDYFTATYYIGEDEFIGCAFRLDDSKVLAAKGAYETFAAKPFHRDRYFIGENCKAGKEYTCRETEATHILTVRAPLLGDVHDLESEPSMLPELYTEEVEELLVDTEGRTFVRSADGSNKIRRLTSVSIAEVIENKIMEIFSRHADDEHF